jgi:hypothetical protein
VSVLGSRTAYQGWILRNATCPNGLRGLQDVVRKRRKRIMRRFNIVYTWLREMYPEALEDLTPGTWAWSYAAIVTRAWTLDGLPSMIPVCDMFNHKYGARVPNQTISGGQTTGFFRLQADRDYMRGEEVFITYSGIVCNRKWLHYYGFLPESNEAVPCTSMSQAIATSTPAGANGILPGRAGSSPVMA